MIMKRIFFKGPWSQQSPHADKRHAHSHSPGSHRGAQKATRACADAAASVTETRALQSCGMTGWGGNSIKADLKSGAASEITAGEEAGAFKVRI